MTIAVDFDGTIVEHAYPKIGKEIPFAIDVLKRLQKEEYHQLVLWTVRDGDLLQEAIQFCRAKGLEFYAVNSNYPEEDNWDGTTPRKLSADLYIDDRNLGGLPDWGVIYRMVKYGETLEEASNSAASEYRKKQKQNFLIRIGKMFEK
jgi:hypothetical protein